MTFQPLTPSMLDRLAGAYEPWLSCDDCFDQVDAVAEGLVTRNRPMSPAFRAHLRGCPACYQEAQTLTDLVAADHGVDLAIARARLDDDLGGGNQAR